LDGPCSTERGCSFDKGASVTSEEHNEDTPFDSKLLNDDNASSLIVFGNFGEVDWYSTQ
jgi:hypothetical protein